MLYILVLLLFLLGVIDRLVGKRLEPGYNVMESDGSVIYRVGSIIILISALIGIFMINYKDTHTFKWLVILVLFMHWGFQAFMEWKYVEGKKYRLTLLLLVIGVVVTWGTFFVDGKINLTTFGAEFNEMLNSEEISKIEILHTVSDENQEYSHKQATIIDENTINKFSTLPSDMELKKSNSAMPGLDFIMTIYTNDGQHTLTFSEEDIRIDDNKYFILDENELIKVIEAGKLVWEPVSF